MGIDPEGVACDRCDADAQGEMNYNSIVTCERKHEPLMRHFEYLLELG